MRDAIDRASRFDTPLALLTFDLDHLEAMNDSRGHIFDDQSLASVVDAVTTVVGSIDTIARFGGDSSALSFLEAILKMPDVSPNASGRPSRRPTSPGKPVSRLASPWRSIAKAQRRARSWTGRVLFCTRRNGPAATGSQSTTGMSLRTLRLYVGHRSPYVASRRPSCRS